MDGYFGWFSDFSHIFFVFLVTGSIFIEIFFNNFYWLWLFVQHHMCKSFHHSFWNIFRIIFINFWISFFSFHFRNKRVKIILMRKNIIAKTIYSYIRTFNHVKFSVTLFRMIIWNNRILILRLNIVNHKLRFDLFMGPIFIFHTLWSVYFVIRESWIKTGWKKSFRYFF